MAPRIGWFLDFELFLWDGATLCIGVKTFKNIVQTAVPTIPLLTDTAPAPELSDGCATLYVDNFAALATDPDTSMRIFKLVCNEVHRRGLSTHEHSDSLDDSDLLGLHFTQSGLITPRGTVAGSYAVQSPSLFAVGP